MSTNKGTKSKGNTLLIAALLLAVGLCTFFAVRSCLLQKQVSQQGSASQSKRIPGVGSQADYAEGFAFAKIVVYDDQAANANGYYDRQVYNSADPSYIGLNADFVLPSGWTVERDFSKKNDRFVDYYTVKAPTDITQEDIDSFIKENNFLPGSFEITSVIVQAGQECSVRGLVEDRVRVNIYVGQSWTYQPCK